MKAVKCSLSLIAALVVSACIFNGGDDGGASSSMIAVKPGFYRGDYGILAGALGLQSEMVLDADGSFHFFEIHENDPYRIARGKWKSSAGVMVWSSYFVSRAYEDDGMDFDEWDTIPADTSLLRRVTDTTFERLEVVPDTLGHQMAQWIPYRRVPVPRVLAPGIYEYTETYTDYFDTISVAGRAFMELHADGSYRDGRFANNVPVYEFESSRNIQAGSFFILEGNRSRSYDTSQSSFESWFEYNADYEYVIHVQDIRPESLQVWIPYDASYQKRPYWAVYRLLQR